MERHLRSSISRPQRVPARVSASLHHEGPDCSSPPGKVQSLPRMAARDEYSSSLIAPSREPLSEDSQNSPQSGESNVQRWFNHYNRRVEPSSGTAFADDEPLYLLHKSSSNNSNDASEPNVVSLHPGHSQILSIEEGVRNPTTNSNSADDYRSVIDDLTVENRKLRERLRRYETPYHSHLEKDKLFEVKIHNLPSRKRRELEDTLHAFASSINDSEIGSTSKTPRKGRLHQYLSVDSLSNNLASPSTSNSRFVDSTYTVMFNSDPTSTSTLTLAGHEGSLRAQLHNAKDQNVRLFLHDIPEGLLPKPSVIMTEKQKKKIVVQRLEQLFSGKTDGAVGSHRQPLQDQEVSRSAAITDEAAGNISSGMEGHREAHILSHDVKVDGVQPVRLVEEFCQGISCRDRNSSATGSTPGCSSQEQRPTRPLDLDPERVQIPSDNVEYIHHLGLSMPELITEDSSDIESDANGWIYLNLLISMAQLHIINVTPDFVRSAVVDFSSKFQLSPDGTKIRWRGGTKITRFRSDSEASSVQEDSPQDSDSIDQTSRIRHKIGGLRGKQNAGQGKFASIPIDAQEPTTYVGNGGLSNEFHYKPLFHHRLSSQDDLTSSEDSSLDASYNRGDSSCGQPSQGPHIWGQRFRSGPLGIKGRENGPIVFYRGAQFCTDLSGDRGSISAPSHATSVDKDEYSSHTQYPLGISQRRASPALVRTISGSLLLSRPFRNHSNTSFNLETEKTGSKTPELVTDDLCSMDLSLRWSSDDHVQAAPLLDLSPSGLGGTQPADHFVIRVKTRQTELVCDVQTKEHEYSEQGRRSSFPGTSTSGFQCEPKVTAESIMSRLAAPTAILSLPQFISQSTGELRVKTEVLSTHFCQLKPSLPPPTGYFTTFSSSDDESDSSSSPYSEISCLTTR